MAHAYHPRTLRPLDADAIVSSVSRTGRLVVAHEAVTAHGFGAEAAAVVQELALDRLLAPFAPVPASPALEDAYLVGALAYAAVTSSPQRVARHSSREAEGTAR